MEEFIRGDTFPFKTRLTYKNEQPVLKSDIETLLITCRKAPDKYFPIIFQKNLEDVEIDSNGYCHVVFKPEDTETLEYGIYFFDIEVTLKNGYRKTKLESFALTQETSTHGGEENGI